MGKGCDRDGGKRKRCGKMRGKSEGDGDGESIEIGSRMRNQGIKGSMGESLLDFGPRLCLEAVDGASLASNDDARILVAKQKLRPRRRGLQEIRPASTSRRLPSLALPCAPLCCSRKRTGRLFKAEVKARAECPP